MSDDLEIRDCVFGYRFRKSEKKVIFAAQLHFRIGDFCVLYGKNGSGKSTVLRTLAGLQPPLGGTVTWNGENWASFSAHRRSQTAAAVLTAFPETGLFSAFETAALGRSPYTDWRGRLSQNDIAIIEQALHDVGCFHLKNRIFHSLSDGEKQKIMTARALVQQTPLLFLDEPTAFLDYSSKKDFFHFLSELAHQNKKIVIVSTHDLTAVKKENPQFLFCNNGEITECQPDFQE